MTHKRKYQFGIWVDLLGGRHLKRYPKAAGGYYDTREAAEEALRGAK